MAHIRMIEVGAALERTMEFGKAVMVELRELENQIAIELGQRTDRNTANECSSMRDVPTEVLMSWKAGTPIHAPHWLPAKGPTQSRGARSPSTTRDYLIPVLCWPRIGASEPESGVA